METNGSRFNEALALLTVAETGGFTRAAERLGLSKAQVSKLVTALETSLGVKLLHRTTRRVALTDAGRLYLDFARQARQALGDGERAVSAVRTEVDGLIRLTAPTSFGDGFLVDLLADFRAHYPAVRFDVDLSIGTRDLVAEGFDFAIRMARTLDPNLVARPLGVVREAIVASPAFLAAHAPGGVHEPAQLSGLEALRNRSFRDEGQWLLQRGEQSVAVPVQGNLAINHFIGLRRAALLGQGVARLPRYLVHEELERGGLVELLPGWQLPHTPVALVYPSREHLPHRSQVFRDFVIAWVGRKGVLD
ncbi:LysR family transcriptional regulator [Arenimonas sp.]|uniref:LysR family transcriptional regulator n=1 Tax=Arenimonas sp. TaxID=1872635 RepID=UPI0035B4C1C9